MSFFILALFVAYPLYLVSKNTNFVKYITISWFAILLGNLIYFYTLVPESGYLFIDSMLPVDSFGFALELAVDKLSMIMLLLTSLLLFLVALASWEENSAYFSLLLFFSGAIIALFMTTNLLWFFIFWELTLIPMFFFIGVWGAEQRIYASIKFFLYTHIASMFFLLAIFLIYHQTGTFTIYLIKESSLETPSLIWWLLFLGFVVKIPLFPFHTWLPDAHVQAPGPISALLAGVLLKMGAYALIKFNILVLPQEALNNSWILTTLGVITLLFAGFKALYETHIKKMIAYSSISHMGLVAVAVGTVTYSGLSAGMFEMISHALVISTLFIIAGFIHHKTGSWQMEDFGGLMQKAPYISTLFLIAGFGALGLPGTVGFIGELTIFLSAIKSYGIWILIILLGSMVTASYFILTFRKVIYAKTSSLIEKSNFKMHPMVFISLLIFTFFTLLLGVLPMPIFDAINQAFYQFLGAK